MVSEFLQSLRQSIEERVRNPLLGSFALFWCFFNWRIIIIVLFSASATERIEQLEKFELLASNLLRLAVFPGIAAIAYVAVMPWISYGVQRYQLGIVTRQKEHKLDTEQKLMNKRLAIAQTKRRVAQQVFDIDMETNQLKNELQQAKHDVEWKDDEHKREIVRLTNKADSYKNTQNLEGNALQAKVAELEQKCIVITDAKNATTNELSSDRDQRKALQARIKELEQRIKDFETPTISSTA